MNAEKIQGLIRHVLTFGGGILVSKGLVDETTMLELVGGATTLLGFLWSFLAPEKKTA